MFGPIVNKTIVDEVLAHSADLVVYEGTPFFDQNALLEDTPSMQVRNNATDTVAEVAFGNARNPRMFNSASCYVIHYIYLLYLSFTSLAYAYLTGVSHVISYDLAFSKECFPHIADTVRGEDSTVVVYVTTHQRMGLLLNNNDNTPSKQSSPFYFERIGTIPMKMGGGASSCKSCTARVYVRKNEYPGRRDDSTVQKDKRSARVKAEGKSHKRKKRRSLIGKSKSQRRQSAEAARKRKEEKGVAA